MGGQASGNSGMGTGRLGAGTGSWCRRSGMGRLGNRRVGRRLARTSGTPYSGVATKAAPKRDAGAGAPAEAVRR